MPSHVNRRNKVVEAGVVMAEAAPCRGPSVDAMIVWCQKRRHNLMGLKLSHGLHFFGAAPAVKTNIQTRRYDFSRKNNVVHKAGMPTSSDRTFDCHLK